jgi:hypothetical protein
MDSNASPSSSGTSLPSEPSLPVERAAVRSARPYPSIPQRSRQQGDGPADYKWRSALNEYLFVVKWGIEGVVMARAVGPGARGGCRS